jgi:hypothetical protein
VAVEAEPLQQMAQQVVQAVAVAVLIRVEH